MCYFHWTCLTIRKCPFFLGDEIMVFSYLSFFKKSLHYKFEFRLYTLVSSKVPRGPCTKTLLSFYVSSPFFTWIVYVPLKSSFTDFPSLLRSSSHYVILKPVHPFVVESVCHSRYYFLSLKKGFCYFHYLPKIYSFTILLYF